MNGGEISIHFINSVLVTVVIAPFVLWRYRRAILGGMQRGGDEPLPVPDVEMTPSATSGSATLLGHEKAMRQRLSLAWLLTTFICGLPLAVAYYLGVGDHLSPTLVLATALCYTLAAAPMIAVSLALPLPRVALLLVGLLFGFALLMLLAGSIERAAAGRPIGWKQLGLFMLFFSIAWNQLWMAAIYWLLSWPVRLRGVVPITFAGLLLFGLAPLAGTQLTAALARTEFATPWVYRLGLNGVFLMLALPAGWLAWRRLQAVAAAYQAKRVSDAQLLARMWWLMLVATIGLDIYIGREQPLLALLTAFAVIVLFAPVNGWLLQRLGVTARAAAWPPRNLLLLRIFGYTARTERLFDRVAARWRLIGPVTMIAAPDVTARTIDPGDFLHWLTGRADEPFITSRASLDARLAAIDLAPDPDGRFRINAFCCRDATWQATVVELMARADAVIMDVRGITRARSGCEFELQQLALRLPLQRLVLVIDDSTDRPMLQATLGPGMSDVHWVEMRRSRDADRVFDALLDAAS